MARKPPAAPEKTWSDMQKTSLRLDPELHRRLRILAIERGTTFGELVEKAVREFLERESGRSGRKA